MRRGKWLVTGLIALNALLAMAVYQRVGGDKAAQAQLRGRSDFVAVSGAFQGGGTLLYVLEANSGVLSVFRSDTNQTQMVPMDRHLVADDFSRINGTTSR